MEITTIGLYRPRPGRLLRWQLTPAGAPTPHPVPPSFNQRFHLAGAAADGGGNSVWLAGAFDVDGPVDVGRLTGAFTAFAARHPTLRSGFRPEGGGFTRLEHADLSAAPAPEDAAGAASSDSATAVAFSDSATAVAFSDAGQLRDELWRAVSAACRPLGYPAFLFAAVDRPDRSTVVAAFDHLHVDGFSVALAVSELSRLYLGGDLDPPGDFVADTAAELAAEPVGRDDWRVGRWREFLAQSGGTAPAFPLDLGAEPGTLVAQGDLVVRLLDAGQADRFQARCRGLGASAFTGLLTAVGLAARAGGGPAAVPVLMPVHTRHSPRARAALGWYTNTVPVVVDASGASFEANLPATHASFRQALDLARVPLAHALGALGDDFTRVRRDVFMVSYLDYRSLPAPAAGAGNPTHISNSAAADDAQFWFWRNGEGLSLRARHPGTDLAAATLARFTGDLRAVLAREAG